MLGGMWSPEVIFDEPLGQKEVRVKTFEVQ
jgi:hypothetical protein